MRRLTLDELVHSEKEYFTPDDICGVMGVDPHSIRMTAKQRPELLGFNFFFIGTRMKIPKIPFLRKMGIDITGGQYEQ